MTAEAGKAAVRAFIDAFNACDVPALADSLNYPHIRLAAGRFTNFETREDALRRHANMAQHLAAEGWHHTTIESITVVQAGPDKVHMDIDFTRRRADDSVYHRFPSLWIATLQDGRWGIKFRSSYLEG